MKSSGLERFAQSARKQLHVEVRARLKQIREGDLTIELAESGAAVAALNKRCAEIGEDAVVEEAAYTWFNRICALRYMDARGYNPTMIVSAAEGKTLPEVLSDAMAGVIDPKIVESGALRERVRALLDGSFLSENAQADAYRILFVAACNSLNAALPNLFVKIDDPTMLLLPDDLLSSASVVTQAVAAMTGETCASVEVIGWLYQYYASEKKAEVFAGFKKGKKAGAAEIPAATQLFTPEWIVRCLVENSLGRLWMLNHPESSLKDKMKYYVEGEAEEDFARIGRPEDIRLLDPCCGSGHILVYAFDLLVEIYRECGVAESEAAERILRHNLAGAEIDGRAGQLAWFALMMKARERSRRILGKGVWPRICVIKRIEFAKSEEKALAALFVPPAPPRLAEKLSAFAQADVLGSLLEPLELARLEKALLDDPAPPTGEEAASTAEKAARAFAQAGMLCGKYHVVVTNPPYLAPSSAVPALQSFAKAKYPNSKTDTGTMFIERALRLVPENGYVAMVTLQSWMFLSSFEGLRQEIIENRSVLALFHVGARGFDTIGGEVVSTAAFVLYGKRRGEEARGSYFRLVDGRTEEEKSAALMQAVACPACPIRFEASPAQFAKIPGSPIAYWAGDNIINLFSNRSIKEVSSFKRGISTGDNNRFLRLWFEVWFDKIDIASSRNRKKWQKYNKGGEYRKWYGNREYVVNWENDANEIRNLMKDGKPASYIRNEKYHFIPNISYSSLTSGHISFRLYSDFLNDQAGNFFVVKNQKHLLYLFALLNSNVFEYLKDLKNCTLNITADDIESIPFIYNEESSSQISELAKANIAISRADWDSFETSWDFATHPLLRFSFQPPAASCQRIGQSKEQPAEESSACEAKDSLQDPKGWKLVAGSCKLDSNIALSRADWDSFETSWDFATHPLLRFRAESLEAGTEQAASADDGAQPAGESGELLAQPQGYELKANSYELDSLPDPKGWKLEAGSCPLDSNIALSRADWDSFETSWDFAIHPLLRFRAESLEAGTEQAASADDDAQPAGESGELLAQSQGYELKANSCELDSLPAPKGWKLEAGSCPLESAYLRYKECANAAFFQLKRNEEELNRIFIGVYGLEGELQPDEDCSMVSVHRVFDSKEEVPESMRKGQYALTKEDVAKSLISYSVGCMFGRYDPARPGLIFAGGEFSSSSYSDEGLIAADNVIPVLPDTYFADDGASGFYRFLSAQFGKEAFADSLRFVEEALGKSARDYLFKDFYKDHVKAYQKRPIYWLFASPKGHFAALVYAHRWSESTAGAVLKRLRQFREKVQMQLKAEEKGGSAKRLMELEGIDDDLNDYETNILFPLAAARLELSLDDGVKANLQKLGRAVRGI